MWGITSFDYQPSVGRFVFPASGSVFYCDDDQTQSPLFPHELKHSVPKSSHLNPQMCPSNPNLVAYINNYDLWVHNIISSSDVRLTFARKTNRDSSKEPLSAGIPSYITQEEFNRYTGFWWQPVCTPADNGTFRILYEEIDESEVELLYIPCPGEEKETEVYRFPRAGTKNAKSTLKIAQFRLSPSNQNFFLSQRNGCDVDMIFENASYALLCIAVHKAITRLEEILQTYTPFGDSRNRTKIEVLPHLQLSESLTTLYPDMEYLVRVGWTPDGRHVWAKVLDRQQSHEQLLLLPFSSFVSSEPCCSSSFTNHVESTPIAQVIYEEFSDAWINVTDVLYFFTQENPIEITFLWASEENGFRHLYNVTVELLMSSLCKMNTKGRELPRRIKKKVALTSGNWEVSESDVWVNEKKRLVYFIGLKDTPLERHLYVVDIDNPQEPIRLTELGYSHSIAMNDECTLFVDIQSNINQCPYGVVQQIYYPLSYPYLRVKVQPLGYFTESTPLPVTYRQPELFSHTIESGHLIYGMIFKPPDMIPGEKYPTVLTIYGGPEVQLVTNSYKGMRYLRQFLLSSEGYVVVSIDCRGSRHRGVAFESHIKGRMGTVEIADQVEVLLWLSETTGFIDRERIAVHGWSYGGYLSLMGLLQRPDVFKVAIAGAPVTSWTLYDTGYTERYMGTPDKNATGYSTGSVIANANKFPDEVNRLLIIHGLRDENVHFAHTSSLVSALTKAGNLTSYKYILQKGTV